MVGYYGNFLTGKAVYQAAFAIVTAAINAYMRL
jgi:hypothetical protein